MSRPSPIGVDISSRWIAAAQVERSGMAQGPRPLVRRAVCIARARASGSRPDAAELARFADVLDRRGFRGNEVVIAAPDDRLVTAALELPPLNSEAPVHDLAKSEVARTHRLDPEACELALWEIPGGLRASEGGDAKARGAGGAAQYMAAALTHADGESLLAAFEAAGLRVRAIEARAWAMAAACRPLAGEGVGGAALLDLGESAALLVLVQDGTVVYQRAMNEAALDALRSRLAASLGLSPEVLEFVLGGGTPAETPGGSVPLPDGAGPLIDEYIEAIAAEARAAFDYVSRRPSADGVLRLVAAGAGARVPGVPERLGRALGIEVAVAAPATLAECPGQIAEVCRDARLASALGLALLGGAVAVTTGGRRGAPDRPRGVNLIPARRRLARERRTRVQWWAGALAAYALALGGVYAWLARGSAPDHDWDAGIALARREAEAAREDARLLRAEAAREESAMHAAASVRAQPDWSMLFALIARTAGDAIWIESAALGPPAPRPDSPAVGKSGPASGSRAMILSLAGLGESQEGVSSFVLGLEETGLFGSVRLLETRRQAHNERAVMAFRVECLLEVEP